MSMTKDRKTKCCYCGVESLEPMGCYLYGGNGHGWLYQCINLPECINRVRANYERDTGKNPLPVLPEVKLMFKPEPIRNGNTGDVRLHTDKDHGNLDIEFREGEYGVEWRFFAVYPTENEWSRLEDSDEVDFPMWDGNSGSIVNCIEELIEYVSLTKGAKCSRCGWCGGRSELQADVDSDRCPDCNYDMSLDKPFLCPKCDGVCEEAMHATFRDYVCEECGQAYNSSRQEIAHPYGENNELLNDGVY